MRARPTTLCIRLRRAMDDPAGWVTEHQRKEIYFQKLTDMLADMLVNSSIHGAYIKRIADAIHTVTVEQIEIMNKTLAEQLATMTPQDKQVLYEIVSAEHAVVSARRKRLVEIMKDC